MRIAIAEVCGVTKEMIQRWLDYSEAERQFQSNEIKVEEYYRRHLQVEPEPIIPNYPRDLNAMHEAWKVLDTAQRARFAEELAWVVLAAAKDPQDEFVFSRCSLALYANATAGERAEAFLRTVGKWKHD